MLDLKKIYLEEEKLRKLIDILRKNGAVKIAIFGSRVRDDWKKDSDVDVLVKFDKKMDLLEFIGIKQEIEDEIGEKIDLITFDGLDETVKDQVLKEMVIPYDEK